MLTCYDVSLRKTRFLTGDIESIWALTPDKRAGGVYAAEPFVLVTFAPWEQNKKKESTSLQTEQSAVSTINHMSDRLIKQLLCYGCIIGCCHIISLSACLHRGVQFNVLIFSKSFCLMAFYQCYYDFINISISAVNDHISQRSPV